MLDQATYTSTLIVRAQQNKRDPVGALRSATELLDVSRKSNHAALIESSEELMGDILGSLEHYPEALSHYEEALRLARSIHEHEPYQALHCAGVLWPLGRYSKALNMLAVAESGKSAGMISGAELVKGQILLSQEKFDELIVFTNRELTAGLSQAIPEDLPQFRLLRARAEVHSGQLKRASYDVSDLSAWAQKEGDEDAATNIKTDSRRFLDKPADCAGDEDFWERISTVKVFNSQARALVTQLTCLDGNCSVGIGPYN
jgi:tetratricopeptide (TPR) repeat protein